MRTNEDLPFHLEEPKSFSLDLISGSLKIKDMRVVPRKETKKFSFKPFQIKEIRIVLGLAQIIHYALHNELSYKKVLIKANEVTLLGDQKASPESLQSYIDLSFPSYNKGILATFPVQREMRRKSFQKAHVEFHLDKVSLRSHQSNLSLRNVRVSYRPKENSFDSKISIDNLDLRLKKKTFSGLSLRTRLSKTKNGLLFLKNSELEYLNSKIYLEGSMALDKKLRPFREKTWSLTGLIRLNDFKGLKLKPNKPLGPSGELKLNLHYKSPSLAVELDGKDIVWDKSFVKRLEAYFKLDSKTVAIRKFFLRSKEGHFKISETNLIKKKTSPIQLSLKSFQLGSFLHEKLFLEASGQIECSTTLLTLSVSCKSQDPLLIKNIDFAKKIQLEKLEPNIKFQYNKEELKYNLFFDQQSRLSGRMNFKNKEHSIDVLLDDFKLNQVERLYGHSVKGLLSSKGTLAKKRGDISFQSSHQLKNVVFKKRVIKEFKANISYENKKLSVQEFKARFRDSNYEGHFDINYRTQSVNFDVASPHMSAADLREIPIESHEAVDRFLKHFLGVGSFKIQGSTDFKMKDLGFNLDFNLLRGSIFNEYFDELRVSVRSKKNGKIAIENSFLRRDKDKILIDGEMSSEIMDIKIKTNKFYFDPSFFQNPISHMRGNLKFKSTITGSFRDPLVEAKGLLQHSSFHNNNDILFSFKLTNKYIKGSLDFFNKKFHAIFQYPLKKKVPFKISGFSKDFDFLRVSSFLEERQKESAKSQLTSKFDFYSPTGDLWDLRGFLKISDIRLTSNKETYTNRKPIKFSFKNRVLKATEFSFSNLDYSTEGGTLFLRRASLKRDSLPLQIKAEEKSNHYLNGSVQILPGKKLNLTLDGSMNLNFFQFLAPVSMMNGKVMFKLSSTGQSKNPTLNGSIRLEDGFLWAKTLNSPLEGINSRLEIKNNTIRIKEFSSRLKDSIVNGKGSIILAINKEPQVDILFGIKNLNIEYPRGLKLKGKLGVVIKGKHSPYKISGALNLKKGFISSDELQNEKLVYVHPNPIFRKTFGERSTDLFVLNRFHVDAEEIRFVDENINITARGNLSLLGSLNNPTVKGQASILPESQFTFQSNDFLIKRGAINYNNQSFENPRVFLVAETDLNVENITYNINLKIDGSIKKNKISFSSDPPMSHFEILTLLNSKIRPEKLDSFPEWQEGVATQGIYQIGSFVFSSLIGKRVRKRLGLDVQLLQSEKSDLTNDNFAPKLRVQKRLSDRANLSVSRTFGEFGKNNIDFKYKLTDKWSIKTSWESEDEKGDNPSERSNPNQNFDINLEYIKRFK